MGRREWAGNTCMWNAPLLAGQSINVCKMHPGLLDRIDMNAKWTLSCWVNIHLCKMHPGLLSSCWMYAKCTLACWAEYTYVQKGPWVAGWNKHVQSASWLVGQNILRCKLHPGSLGKLYIYAKCTLACWAELGRIYIDAKCILVCWADYACMQNAP